MLTNYHSHSHYCDGKGSPEQQVQGALAQGLRAFGFSSHCPVSFDNQWSMKAERLDEYLAETRALQAKYEGQIELYVGLEVDFIPEMVGPSDFPMLDYCVGSVHYVGLNQFGQPWEIDGSSVEFLECLDTVYGGDIQAVIQKYYGIIRQMVETDPPQVMGHLDKIKMHNAARHLFDESESWYVAEVEQTLQAIAKAGITTEINTRGNYKRGLELYPSPWIINRMKELNIPICINSDSHRPEEITASFPLAYQVAKAAGYEQVRILLGGKWQDVAL
ncbi:histidinol-phosphatase [Runella aurantiaca]|uniref:Histidinol-phosphatase n=1 Tax=Runella aurantiaca TaxID=2282308 RepID=A0A369II88_9BACT|nr:histidinol-phosphatase [Runella aurantiaca]RDB07103.1 PHP domain-containing protein [Runella aurantiaca]